jgi:hypothetical protein
MAKANSAARSLIEISKTQGWDSTRIWDQEKGAYGESMIAWDHPREPFDKGLGEVPGGLPAVSGDKDPTGGPVMSEQITWNYPDVSRESKEEGKPKMTLSNPDPGGGY